MKQDAEQDKTIHKAKRLAQAKKSVYKQAMPAGFVILLTVVLVFTSITAWTVELTETGETAQE